MSDAATGASNDGSAIRAKAEILNKRGLHARASAKFVTLAAKFQCEVTVTRDGTTVSGRSIMGLMMLGASMGSTIDICAQGPDAANAVQALLALVAGKFEEDI
jgi:phosphocarrier protein